MMARGASRVVAGLLALLLAGCGEVDERLIVVFPDDAVREATDQLTVTAFAPILEEQDAETRFVGCDAVGVFKPTALVSPAEVASRSGLGRVLLEREPLEFEEGFETSVSFVRPQANARNPWGAVLVVVEARGDVLGSRPGSGERTATLASGCFCVRTLNGTHPDAQLDATVKRSCAPIERTGGVERTVELEPVAPSAFRLEPCDTDQVTGPAGGVLRPGPRVCLRTTTCQTAPGSVDCFDCDGSCPELEELGEVPVLFEVAAAGGGITPPTAVVVTEVSGAAFLDLDLAGCTGDFEVSARVLGRRGEVTRFRGSCVEPVPPFGCRGEFALGATTESLTVLPPVSGGQDLVAVVQEQGADDTAVRVVDLRRGALVDEVIIAGESPEAVHGFTYEIDGGQPLLAVATGREVGKPRPALWLRVFRWDGARLTQTATLAEPCGKWSCGSLSRCEDGCEGRETCLVEDGVCVLVGTPEAGCSDPAVACACQIDVDFGARVSLETADLDGDGRADLLATSSGSVPVTTWYSGQAGPGELYAGQGCRCGTYGTTPSSIAVANVGGPDEPARPRLPDLWVASSGGTYVVYARSTSGVNALQCGQAKLVGEIIASRDVARGRFSCRPETDPSCSAYEDVVVAAAPEGATGGFGAAGYVRVIFGGARDLSRIDSIFDTPKTHIRLASAPNPTGTNGFSPEKVEVTDLNGDGHDDVVVLFAGGQVLNGWLGRSNRGLGAIGAPVNIAKCETSLVPESECRPLDAIGLPDLDGDGRAEMVVVCDPSNPSARLRWYASSAR